MPPKTKRSLTREEKQKKREMEERRVAQATRIKKGKGQEEPRETRPDGSPVTPGSSHQGEQLGDWSSAQMKKGWTMRQDPDNTKSKTAIAAIVGVPKSTFMDRCRILEKKTCEGEVLTERDFIIQSGGKLKPRALSSEEEFVLKGHIASFGQRGFPLRPQEVRTMAHEIAEKKVGRKGDEMSYKWQQKFLQRHDDMKMKKPKQMSMARASPDVRNVDAWFNKYKAILVDKEISDPNQVWNIDETGVHECPQTGMFMVNDKSKAPFIIPRERGQNITILSYCSAAGTRSPPMIIMKGKNRMDAWAEHMPRSWHLRASASGYINKGLFAEYGNIFINYLHSQNLLDLPHVVILDGHRSHTYNSLFLITMRINHVEVLALPPHTTHFLQPLDSTPYSAFKAHWKKELRIFNRKRSGVAMNKPQFFLVFPRAWRLGMSAANIQWGFTLTGIWPVDRHAINDEVFQLATELSK